MQKCGGCHTLADAGTQGQIGPNLDDAFAVAREQGFEEPTIQSTSSATRSRIPSSTRTTGAPGMPAEHRHRRRCRLGRRLRRLGRRLPVRPQPGAAARGRRGEAPHRTARRSSPRQAAAAATRSRRRARPARSARTSTTRSRRRRSCRPRHERQRRDAAVQGPCSPRSRSRPSPKYVSTNAGK